MADDAPTSLQTGVTPNPIASNTQDFSNSDDEILDNFADGPDPNDDGTPMGLGGDKEKQAEPASSTLEADIVNGTTKQPGEEHPPENSASEPEPVQEPASETGTETSPESKPEALDWHCDYVYVAGLDGDSPGGLLITFELPLNHKQEYANYLRCDSAVGNIRDMHELMQLIQKYNDHLAAKRGKR